MSAARGVSRGRVVEASAPARIDLAGGTLDLWPISVALRGAATVNLAIELRAHARVEPIDLDGVEVVSVDRRARVTRPRGRTRRGGRLGWPLALLEAFGVEHGVRLTTRATAPAGAGLGGSSTLGVAIAAALARATGAKLSNAALLTRVLNLEASHLGVPTGNQDYLAAIHGGLSVYHHAIDGTRREAVPLPARLARRLERRLVLGYTGAPRDSGLSNWDVYRRFVDGDRETVRILAGIARTANRLRDALVAGDLDRAGREVAREGRLRYRLGRAVATPELVACGEAATRAGAIGVKPCGAGGGGCFVAWVREERSDAVARAIETAGAEVLPVEIAKRGVRVSARPVGAEPDGGA